MYTPQQTPPPSSGSSVPGPASGTYAGAYGQALPPSMAAGTGLGGGRELFNFWQIWRILRKWGWLIALLTVAATAAAYVLLSRMTPIYSAATTVEVKQQVRNIVGGANVEDVNADTEFFTTQIELLKSQSLAETVIEALNLTSDPDFIDPTDPAMQALPRTQRLQQTLSVYNENLKVSPVGRSRLIELQFEHSDPRRAALIANTIADNFISNAIERKFSAGIYAREFLEERLAAVQDSLETAERDLVQYASDNDILVLGGESGEGGSGSLKKSALVTLDKQLTEARTARMSAQQAFTNAQKADFSLEVLSSGALNTLKAQRMTLNAEYIRRLAIFKPNFPDMIELKSRIDLFDETIARETSQIVQANRANLETAYQIAQAQEDDLTARVEGLKSDVVNLGKRSIQYTILQRQVDTERTQYEALLQRLKEVSISEDVGSNLVEIVDRAKPARSAFKPNKPRALVLAVILSFALGFGLVYAIEIIDDRVKQPEDIKEKLGKTILGVIPSVSNSKELNKLLRDSQSSIAEAYSTLRANLQFSGMNGGPRILQITSTQPGEGKSVTSLGLALRYASLGEKTLLIDADMRRPTFKAPDKNDQGIGLSGLLTSNENVLENVRPSSFERLDFIISGPSVPNPADILTSERFDEILALAREHYAYIIVDSPPVIGLADAPVIGAKVDATLLVVEANKLHTGSVKAALERLAVSGTHPLGVILTKYKSRINSYSYYKGAYGGTGTNYSQATPKKGEKNKLGKKQKFTL